jgi:hypothetical protein
MRRSTGPCITRGSRGCGERRIGSRGETGESARSQSCTYLPSRIARRKLLTKKPAPHPPQRSRLSAFYPPSWGRLEACAGLARSGQTNPNQLIPNIKPKKGALAGRFDSGRKRPGCAALFSDLCCIWLHGAGLAPDWALFGVGPDRWPRRYTFLTIHVASRYILRSIPLQTWQSNRQIRTSYLHESTGAAAAGEARMASD